MKINILELFSCSTQMPEIDWQSLVKHQDCGYLHRRCLKTRKSEPEIALGTCVVNYGKANQGIIICPHRLLEQRRIFLDSLHLLTSHEPGNDLHLIPEVDIPGGTVDYFLVSTYQNRIRDFIGMELQTLDTTGTVWPERQRFLQSQGVSVKPADVNSEKPFGMNWKMTAKTTLVQLHHKVETFEHLGKHLVLVLQDVLLEYIKREFSFDHIATAKATIGEAMHFHSYKLWWETQNSFRLQLDSRLSTDGAGISRCLGRQAKANLELENMITRLQSKMSNKTLFAIPG